NIIEFKKNFSNNDLSFSLFVEEIKIELKWRKLIYEIFKGRVKSTEKSVEKELNEIIKKQSQIVEYKVSEIEIELQKDGNEIDQIKKIKRFINQIGFENTALKYSSSSSAEQKGDLGWVKENALSKPVHEIIKDLEIGAVSKPIKKLNKITFLKLVDKKKVSIDPKNKEKIKNDLIAAKENDLFILYSSSYLSRLKNNTLIEYK
ncbi:MAG: peptidylprolyl isomerase, partial [Pseudomonadota bacterium]|nr:peptidylprolyl isomerase [Pseudomonadota bacterium]